jgi:glycosyltransferase involved in cell wall biosynthesis
MKLIVAAKVDPADRDYYDTVLSPLFRRHRIEFIGEVDDAGKDQVLGGAYAYLFPVNWPEPFGLTMVEAMATGTPVIAASRGSVPEVVEHGRTGFVTDTIDEMVAALDLVPALDRAECRRHVEDCFSVTRMADGYEEAYRAVITRRAER